ncbi:MAG: hypothetical protein NTW61_02285 [Candidatus Melainabacteria bacterium]|nr:hypothetical protein [Candidatus Melainabacteria bacterium]
MVAPKASTPLAHWLFISSATLTADFEQPNKQAWQKIAPSLALFAKPATGLLPASLVQLAMIATTNQYEQDVNSYKVASEKNCQLIEHCYTACQVFCPKDHDASEKALVLLHLVVKAFLQLQELPNLDPYWEALTPHLLLMEAEIATNHALHLIANKADLEEDTKKLLGTAGATELSAIFHYNLSQLLLSKVLYHVWGNELDLSHQSLRLLKQAALTYEAPIANIYLSSWSLACLEVAQTYANLKNTRDLRLLYEDISLACESLKTSVPEAIEAKGKTAELLLWCYRHQPTSEKPKQLFRELYDVAKQHPNNKTIIMQYLNGAISLSQTYGSQNDFPAAFKLWQQAKAFTKAVNHHTPIQQGLMKLGLNVIWTHNGDDAYDDVLSVYAELAGALHLLPINQQPIILQEFCWATVNISWVYAHKESVTDILLLLEQLCHWQALMPTLPCFVEAKSALYRNALWAIRKTYRQQNTSLETLEKWMLHRLHPKNKTVSAYERLQLGSGLLQLGHYALVLENWDSVKRLQHELYQLHQAFSEELELAKAYAEYCTLVLEQSNQASLEPILAINWKHLMALQHHWATDETLATFALLGSKYWAEGLQQSKRAGQLASLIATAEDMAGAFPENQKIQLAFVQILNTAIQHDCWVGEWHPALQAHNTLRHITNKYADDGAFRQEWGQSLQQLIIGWPSHRDVEKTLPLVQELLELAKLSSGETWWLPILASVRAHHCQSFYLQGFPEYGLKEQQAVNGLLAKNPSNGLLQQAVLACLSSQCLWLQHSQEYQQATVIAKQLLSQGLAWNISKHGWEAPLQACFGVLDALLKNKAWHQADGLFRKLLTTFQQVAKQPNSSPWVKSKLTLFATAWVEQVPAHQETRAWQQCFLFQPTIPQLLKPWALPQRVMNPVTASGVTIEGVQTTYYDSEPTWLAQACFQACLQQNMEEAERFYQQHQQRISQSE